jgi:transcriptional regulator with XRE-family HTH domain
MALLSIRLGKRIRTLRRGQRLSLEALAAKSQLHPTSLQRLETGRLTLTVDTVEKLAMGLGIPIEILFQFDDKDAEPRRQLPRPTVALSTRLGRRVRTLRRRKRLSIEALAGQCALHPNSLQRMETGKQAPTLDTIDTLAAGLEVPVDTLFQFKAAGEGEIRKQMMLFINGATHDQLRQLRVAVAVILEA